MGWQAAILVAVVVGFGAAMFLRVRTATLEQVDADLLGAAQAVAARLQETGSAWQLEIPAAYRDRFGAAPADAPYLVVWDADGRMQTASADAPPDLQPAPEPPAADGPRPFFDRDRGPFREVIVRGPWDWQILVGRQPGRERNELGRLVGWLVGTGLGIVGLGLAWAWFLSHWILAPIRRMAGAAERISASNLAQRIDASTIPSELAGLARVLNRTLARLQASFEGQARFMADASHELRTPVAVVLAQSELALAKPRSPGEYQEALEACRRAAKRMESLVGGLLILARFDAGQLESRHEPVDLRQVVESSLALLRPLADRRRIELACELQTIHVPGNAQQLGQLLANLLGNAVAYNREAGQVRVRLAVEDRAAVLSVSDTGIGIEPSELPRISSDSTAWTMRAPATAAPAWDWRFARRSFAATAGRSTWPAWSEKARRSPSGCRCRPGRAPAGRRARTRSAAAAAAALRRPQGYGDVRPHGLGHAVENVGAEGPVSREPIAKQVARYARVAGDRLQRAPAPMDRQSHVPAYRVLFGGLAQPLRALGRLGKLRGDGAAIGAELLQQFRGRGLG